jgi:hypothetical protein
VVSKRVHMSINHYLHLVTLGAPSCVTVCVEHHKLLGAHKYVVNYPCVTYLTCQWFVILFVRK